MRSIPVCTGKPDNAMECAHTTWVYPRMHGETLQVSHIHIDPEGLSPYARGNPTGDNPRFIRDGSIPVCTGKPLFFSDCLTFSRVYPRMHGETRVDGFGCVHAGGLSPYARGNLLRKLFSLPYPRSIPVCTGKPAERAGV